MSRFGQKCIQAFAALIVSISLTAGDALAATTMTLDKVRSYVYALQSGPNIAGTAALIANSNVDLYLLSGGDQSTPFDRAALDPKNSKLIFNYVDVTEAAAYSTPSLFANGGKSPILGNSVPGFSDLYSVQFWDPLWKSEIHRQIDLVINAGYDGVFLDSVTPEAWQTGNPHGNPVHASALTDLASLVSDIANYVKSKNLGRPFYLLANNPVQIAQQMPSALSSIDAVFQEWVYWGQLATNGLLSEYKGTSIAQGILSTTAPAYKGKLVFGGDYPPLTNYDEVFRSFAFYSPLGWIPSVTKAAQSAAVLGAGPSMFMAVPANPTATGGKNIVNFISGGLVTSATLIGGDKGDYFIGGPGTNTITAGAGNDTIYAHPENVAVRNLLSIKASADSHGGVADPTLTVKINGNVVYGPSAITASYQNGQTQDVKIDTTSFGTVNSIELDSAGPSYVDSGHYTDVRLQSANFQGQTLSFSSGQFDTSTNSQADSSGATATLNPGGRVTFRSPLLPLAAPVFGNVSDTIDGGGGVNTVVYRAASTNYTITNQADGSVSVTSANTAEGPDTLRNIQFVKFTDKTVAIGGAPVRGSATFSTAQSGTQSFLRFFNTGTAAGTATAVLSDYTTGQMLGQWSSPTTIPAGAEIQYAIGNVEAAAGITDTKPSYYSLSVQTDFSGYFQHVLFRPADGTLTNASTCARGVVADPTMLSGVHSSLLSSGYPSSIVITNTGSTAQTVTLGVYDARDGTKLGTYTSTSIPPNGELIPTIAAIESGAKITPSGSMYHYVIKVEGTFTGYLQHLVNNTQKGVITDMTTACSLDGSTRAAATSPLRDGAIFSTAQSASQSFLRFYNTGSSAGTVTVTLRDYASGQSVGTWTSPSVPSGAEQQFSISTVETGANITGTKPSYYAISAVSTFGGYFQHVLFRPSDGTLTNLSTCAAGITADTTKIAGVHTSTLDFGFPSSIAINNTGTGASTVTLGIYDASNGTKLGTYTSASIPAGGQIIPTVAQIEAGANIKPTSSMFHYVLKVESAFTGFLQNLVNNLSAGVITDMTTACSMVAAGP